jgi:glycosyltransferase involved in cell wall biosynthesis
MPQHTLSVVVPMYNEQENAPLQIDAVQEALQHYPMPWEMILVDHTNRLSRQPIVAD